MKLKRLQIHYQKLILSKEFNKNKEELEKKSKDLCLIHFNLMILSIKRFCLLKTKIINFLKNVKLLLKMIYSNASFDQKFLENSIDNLKINYSKEDVRDFFREKVFKIGLRQK